MTIMENINDRRKEIESDGTGETGRAIGRQAVAALLDGRKKGGPWEEYMKNFNSNDQQLGRLLGADSKFNDQPDQFGEKGYGDVILAYIVGAGVCMSGTALRDAVNMPPEMADKLDDFDVAPGPATSPLASGPESTDDTDDPRTFVSA